MQEDLKEQQISVFLGPSLKSPLEIGKEQGGLYILNTRLSTTVPSSQFKPVQVFNSSKKSSSSLATNSSLNSKKSISNAIFNSCFSSSSSNVTEKLWHIRLGHMPLSNMRNIFV
ncbi:hypothetical protein AABB24_012258, partial [Solanum stoloniferum]